MIRKYFYILFAIISCIATSCSDDEPNNGEIQPDKNYPDPEETITVSLYKNTDQNINGIYIDVNDKFTSSDRSWMFCSLGEMKGLGNITSIPKQSWNTSASVKKGCGYVAYNGRLNKYYRLFVSNSASDEMGTITGFQIKYQQPFYGIDETITVEKSDYTVTADGAECEVIFTNSSIIPFKVSTDCDWIEMASAKNPTDIEQGYGFTFRVYSTTSLEPTEGEIKISTYFGKETVIKVSRGAMIPMDPTTTILAFKKKYWSPTMNNATLIPNGVILRGRVVSSDEAGNIFKMFVIQDETAAIQISFNAYNIYTRFPYGQDVAIKFDGGNIYIGRYSGMQQIGSYYFDERESVASITFLPWEALSDVQCIGLPDAQKVQPIDVSLSTLHAALSNDESLCEWQGRYVRISNISFREQNVPFAIYHESTNRMIYDEENYQIVVRTSGYSNFYSSLTPKGVGSISGILGYYNGVWQLYLNSLQDVGEFDPSASIGGNTPPEPDPVVGDGTRTNPYTCAQAIALNNPGKDAWVGGYIVGYAVSNYQYQFNSSSTVSSNIIIADRQDETDIYKCMVVQLPAGPVRDALSLYYNPSMYKSKVNVYGVLSQYMNAYGVKSTNAYDIVLQ